MRVTEKEWFNMEKSYWQKGIDFPIYVIEKPAPNGYWIEFADGSSTWLREINIQEICFSVSDIKRWAYMDDVLNR